MSGKMCKLFEGAPEALFLFLGPQRRLKDDFL